MLFKNQNLHLAKNSFENDTKMTILIIIRTKKLTEIRFGKIKNIKFGYFEKNLLQFGLKCVIKISFKN